MSLAMEPNRVERLILSHCACMVLEFCPETILSTCIHKIDKYILYASKYTQAHTDHTQLDLHR